ncbi:uncharacterized protein DS421_1g32200 [Arachis hypogaea]|nr:uncharacterized protein DS421_1g32200 [Arachis hypogaea]
MIQLILKVLADEKRGGRSTRTRGYPTRHNPTGAGLNPTRSGAGPERGGVLIGAGWGRVHGKPVPTRPGVYIYSLIYISLLAIRVASLIPSNPPTHIPKSQKHTQHSLTQIPETHTATTLLTASVAHRRCCLLYSVAHRRRRAVAHLAALPHRTHFARTSLVAVTLLAVRLFDLQSPVLPSSVVVSLVSSKHSSFTHYLQLTGLLFTSCLFQICFL